MLEFTKQVSMLCSNVSLHFINNLRDDNTHFAAECPSCGHVQITPLPSIDILKILEIGSGYGWFVEKMEKKGFSVDGIELGMEKSILAQKRA